MRKLFGIIAIVLGIWIGAEVYAEGTDDAFGGLFAWLSPVDPYAVDPDEDGSEEDSTAPERAGRAFQRAYNRSERRVDEALDRPAAAE